MSLNEKQLQLCEESRWDFSDLKAIFLNCTLKRSPELSHTEGLIRISQGIMEKSGIATELLRPVDCSIAHGVWPDMKEHGWPEDDWPDILEKVMASDILVIGSSIWLGEKTSVCTKVVERLYAASHLLNAAGQYAYYGRVGGALITGNEDGAKHCAMNILYSLQHLGLRHPAAGRRRLAGRSRTRSVVPRRRVRRTRKRLHQSEYHVYDVEPHAHGSAAERCWRLSGSWQSTHGLGRGLPLRLRQSRVPVTRGSSRRSARSLPAMRLTERGILHSEAVPLFVTAPALKRCQSV